MSYLNSYQKGVIFYQKHKLFYTTLGEQEMADRLKDGNLIICAMGPGDFTNSGHFIVIYDYSRKKFSVNDPFSYTNSSKKWEYTTLISQCQQIWVYAA